MWRNTRLSCPFTPTAPAVAEGSGALPLAAALAMPRRDRGKSVCALTGGNLDSEKLLAILKDGD